MHVHPENIRQIVSMESCPWLLMLLPEILRSIIFRQKWIRKLETGKQFNQNLVLLSLSSLDMIQKLHKTKGEEKEELLLDKSCKN